MEQEKGYFESLSMQERTTLYGKVERPSGELHITQPYASCYEVKDLTTNNTNMLRVYRDSPGSVMLQIRTYEGINGAFRYKAGKPRNMIASLTLGKEELETLIGFLTEKKDELYPEH